MEYILGEPLIIIAFVVVVVFMIIGLVFLSANKTEKIQKKDNEEEKDKL